MDKELIGWSMTLIGFLLMLFFVSTPHDPNPTSLLLSSDDWIMCVGVALLLGGVFLSRSAGEREPDE